MNIVGVAACTIGIAHTYVAQEKLEEAAIEAGHKIHVETQGTIGVENELSQKDIDEADIVILATDVRVDGRERFEGKKIIQVSTKVAIEAPRQIIAKAQEVVEEHQ